MSVSSSEILGLGVGVKVSPDFRISISCLVRKMLDKFNTSYYMTTKEIKKYANTSKIWN